MKERKNFLEKDFLTGVIVCCFGTGMAATTGFSKGVYPMVVFGLMSVIGVYLILDALRKNDSSCLERVSWKEMAMIAFLFLNPVFAKTLGFYLSGYLVIAGISWMIAPEKNGKALVKVLLYSLCVAAAAYVVFTLVLKIATPAGILL